jgi:hypothetical protein
VRHVRMLGLCLVAVFAVSAVFAASAMAKKDPWSLETWGQYKYCPYELTEEEKYAVVNCVYGRTNGGKEGGEFKYGKISVRLNKPIVIQVGLKGAGANTVAYPASNGESLVDAEPEKVVGGLKVISSKIMKEAEWPEALVEAFEAAKHNKEINKATVTVEMASNTCFEIIGCVSSQNLLNREGAAFILTLKVTLHNAWLESLGGGPCTIGSDEHPIEQNLTDETPGWLASLQFGPGYYQVEAISQLVDIHWHIKQESGASGCGNEEWESYIDKALNLALEIESSDGSELENTTGLTWLTGHLYVASAKAVRTKGVESGEL